jgi:hypothetical protein
VLSRRRLFGLLGGAAAAGAGLAVAGSTVTAESAAAADGDAMLIGSSNACDSTTFLQALTAVTAFEVVATNNSITNASAILGQGGPGTGSIGVQGSAANGYGVLASGGRAPLFITPNGGSGPPASGAHTAGEVYIDGTHTLFLCTADGSPGTWVRHAPLVPIFPAARVYDSRVGQPPTTGPKAPITNGATVNVDPTGLKAGGGLSGVPQIGATAVLGNITVVNGSNGVFLTVFPMGVSAPATSNVNAGPGQVIANSFTSPLATHQLSVKCGGGPTDFIIDIVGYYP